MLANFLDKSKPINFIGILLFFCVNFFLTVYLVFLEKTFEVSYLIDALLFFLLLFGIFFFFNFIKTKNNLTFDNSYGYFVFTLLIICILSKLFSFYALALYLIYILFIRKIYSLRTHKKVIEKLFDAGFWLGLLGILEPASISFFLLVYLSIYFHQKVTFQTLFTPIVGFLTPLIIYFTYLFWFGKPDQLLEEMSFVNSMQPLFFEPQKYMVFFNCILVLSSVFAFLKSIKALKINNTFRKNWILVIFNLLVAILVLFISKKNSSLLLIFLTFPSSIIIANGIELIQKRIFRNIISFLLLIACCYFSYFFL